MNDGHEDDDDLFEFIQRLPQSAAEKVFQNCRWTAVAVLRSIDSLGQQLVMRLLSVEAYVEADWLQKSSQDIIRFKSAIQKLKLLKLLEFSDSGSLRLLPTFRIQLFSSVMDVDPIKFPWQTSSGNQDLNPAAVEESAKHRWNSVLHFIVGSSEYRRPPDEVIVLLLQMKLMKRIDGQPRITKRGYEFMLRDVQNQVWLLLKHYTLKSAEPESVLQMLFRLSFCEPGIACEYNLLDEEQKSLLKDLELIGLIHNNDSRLFYPTSLAINVVFGPTKEQKVDAASKAVDLNPESKSKIPVRKIRVKQMDKGEENSGIFIIVETNFQVYAYTQSSLHIEMLKLFVDIEIILPNLVVGVISRQSIRSSLKLGISGKQIIDFLEKHVHPLCHKSISLIPDNITDQILLWEMERNRITATRGCLLETFASEELFDNCVNYAKKNKWLLYSNSIERRMVIEEQSISQMKLKIKEFRN